ncbi:anti sigma-E factor RseA C-terminal domain-containing protein, partial [Cronobacter sakazakii]
LGVPTADNNAAGGQPQVQEQRRRINAMLQDYELQRRLHAEQLQLEQSQTQQAALQVPGNQTLGTQSQ